MLSLRVVTPQESRRLSMNFISPEHIIIALLSVGDGGARKALQRCERPAKSQSPHLDISRFSAEGAAPGWRGHAHVRPEARAAGWASTRSR